MAGSMVALAEQTAEELEMSDEAWFFRYRDPLEPVPPAPGELSDATEIPRATVREVLDFMDLGSFRNARLGGLPYGILKRVETAAVLATDPDLLLLDEPSAGMSPEESHEFGELLLDMRKELGVTIVMIEHHVPLMVGVCDYIYVLNFGKLLVEGEPAYIQNHPEVITAYFGEETTYGAA
jgi:branched-chain amino acid transport system ATP-binding protein